jgi:phage antirepressor YoqD-like protein
MRAMDIEIGKYYRLKDTPHYTWIKVLEILKPRQYPNKNNRIVVEFKKRLVKAFRELAEQAKQSPTPALPDFTDPEQALLFALDKLQENKKLLAITHEQAEVIEKKDTVITQQKDVIETQQDFIDNAFKLHDTMSVDYYCKLISSKQNHFGAVKFRSLMKISGRFVMNRDTYSYMPSQEMLNSGQMEYKSKQPYVDDNGVEHEHSQIRITKKGARTLYAICKKYQKFFKMNENETRGYHYKPLEERRAFLNSLLQENEVAE